MPADEVAEEPKGEENLDNGEVGVVNDYKVIVDFIGVDLDQVGDVDLPVRLIEVELHKLLLNSNAKLIQSF